MPLLVSRPLSPPVPPPRSLLSNAYGTVLALVSPDLDGQDQVGEVAVFWIEHVVLLALPIVWLARRRFPLFAGAAPWVACWLVFWLMHIDLFGPISVLTGLNINFALTPPKIELLRATAGQYYRPAVGFITGVLTGVSFIFTRLIAYASGAVHASHADLALALEYLQQAKPTSAGSAPGDKVLPSPKPAAPTPGGKKTTKTG